MKFHFALFFCLFISQTLKAEIVKINLEPGIFLKVNSAEWTYQYIKALSSVTPHIVESKTNKDLKVIVQKETHAEAVANKKLLVVEKCKAANKFYQESKQGSAKNIQIKNKDVCLIQMTKNDQNNFQIIYPVRFSKNTYDLMSFGWKGKGESSISEVSRLVGDNL